MFIVKFLIKSIIKEPDDMPQKLKSSSQFYAYSRIFSLQVADVHNCPIVNAAYLIDCLVLDEFQSMMKDTLF